MNELFEILKLHHRRYPAMQFQDDIKLLYQHTFGSEHITYAESDTFNILKNEYEKLRKSDKQRPFAIPIGNHMIRMDLQVIDQKKLSLHTFHKLFLAGQHQKGTPNQYRKNLQILNDYYHMTSSPYQQHLRDYVTQPDNEYQAVSHSEHYKKLYHPSYRLMEKHMEQYLDIFEAIDVHLNKHETLLLAIEGNSGAGKSTLASLLSSVYDANVFHMDDYFLRPTQRTASRLSEPGGNVDYERFFHEILHPLLQQKTVIYSPYNCQKQQLMEPVSVPYKSINIIEGVYSMHPYFRSPYDIRIFLNIEKEEQQKRIENRNGSEMLLRFLKEWIPMEKCYIEHFQIAKQCDLII